MIQPLLTVLLLLAWASNAFAQAHIVPQKADPATPRSGEEWISTTVPGLTFYDGTTKYRLIDSRLAPQALGGLSLPSMQLRLTGTFSGSGGSAIGVGMETSLTPSANGTAFGMVLDPVLVEAASGTHPQMGALSIQPIFTPGAAATTEAFGISIPSFSATAVTNTALKIAGPTSGGTNYSLFVTDGASRLDGGLGVGTTPVASNTITFASFLFANIGTALTANGQIGYCSDCTTASPCAGGGTGAFAQRLNGVNVCGVSLTPIFCDGTNCTMASGQLKLPDGLTTAPVVVRSANTAHGFFFSNDDLVWRGGASSATVALRGSTFEGISLRSASNMGWSSTSDPLASQDVRLFRDAANVLAQRNGTNPQTRKWANTWTSTTNYEYGKAEWASNVFRIGTEKGSGGGTARDYALITDNTVRGVFDAAGGFSLGATKLAVNDGGLGGNTTTAAASAPGAAGGKIEWRCGTNAGTIKIVAYGGTSSTGVTVLDNIGSSVSGC